jgi:hypothetical protein
VTSKERQQGKSTRRKEHQRRKDIKGEGSSKKEEGGIKEKVRDERTAAARSRHVVDYSVAYADGYGVACGHTQAKKGRSSRL